MSTFSGLRVFRQLNWSLGLLCWHLICVLFVAVLVSGTLWASRKWAPRKCSSSSKHPFVFLFSICVEGASTLWLLSEAAWPGLFQPSVPAYFFCFCVLLLPGVSQDVFA